jgi:hypothetical protein
MKHSKLLPRPHSILTKVLNNSKNILNHINMRIHGKQGQVPNFLEKKFLLREINYKIMMVCLGCKKFKA